MLALGVCRLHGRAAPPHRGQLASVWLRLRSRTSGLFCFHFCGLLLPKNVDGKEIRHSFLCVKVSTTSWLPKAQNLHLLLPECQKPHLFSARQSPQPVIKAILHCIILEVEVWDRINQILFLVLSCIWGWRSFAVLVKLQMLSRLQSHI